MAVARRLAPEHARAFIQANTAIASPPLLPELRLHLATEVAPLWQATERDLEEKGIDPPFWAFAWAGGQALARCVLDRPELVRGRVVVDFASGSGLCAIAAALAGAARVIALDYDPIAAEAIRMNAELHGVHVEARTDDVLAEGATPPACDVVLGGDVCYDRHMAPQAVAYLSAQARAGALVLIGDPGRAYLPSSGLVEVTRYRVPTIDDVEATREKLGVVYRVGAGG